MSKIHPITLILLSYIVGIIFGAGQLALSVKIILFFIWVIPIIFLYINKKFSILISCALLLILGGVYSLSLINKIQNPPFYLFNDKNVEINGYLISNPENSNGIITFYLKTIEMEKQKCSQKLLVKIKDEGVVDDNLPVYGDLVSLKGLLKTPNESRNPGEFNYRSYLGAQKIHYILYVPSYKLIHEIKPQNKLNILNIVYNFRKKIYLISEKYHPSCLGELFSGIVLGASNLLSKEMLEKFKITGTLHAIAASGLNVAIVIGFFIVIFNYFKIPLKKGSLIIIPFVIFYLFLAGASPSIVRASIMGIIALVAIYFDRVGDILYSVLLSALLMLLFNPLLLFNVSFQLSFAAVVGMIYLCPFFYNKLAFLPKWLNTAISASLAAEISLYPFLTWHFFQISIIAPVANIFVVPLIGVLLPLSIIECAVGAIWLPLSAPFAFVNNIIISAVIFFIENLAKIPNSMLWTGRPSIIFIFIYYLVLVLLIYVAHNQRYYKTIGLSLSAMAFLFILLKLFIPGCLEVVFLDVGEGDSAVLRLPYGKTTIVDTGPPPNKELYTPPIINYLHYKGVTKIENLIITHVHKDHAGNVNNIINDFRVNRIILPETAEYSEDYLLILKKAGENKIPVFCVKYGDKIDFNGKINLLFLNPMDTFLKETNDDTNNNSMVFKLTYKESSFLFAGDMQSEGQERLVNLNTSIKSNVLKVPHHGSIDALCMPFLNMVSPEYSMISSSQGNKYNHPHPETVLNLKKIDSLIYRTDTNGAIMLKTDGSKITVTPFIKAEF